MNLTTVQCPLQREIPNNIFANGNTKPDTSTDSYTYKHTAVSVANTTPLIVNRK